MTKEKRTTCEVCGNKLSLYQRKFCSPICCRKFHNKKNATKQAEWQRKRNDLLASKPSSKKVQCLICGRWYVQVGSHIVQKHGYNTCREYREDFGLEVKRGIVPKWYRKKKGDQALKNGTFENLKAGEKYWFKPNDKKAGKYKRSKITLERLSLLGKRLYKPDSEV